ncbi:MAG: cupin-like domain-containing protein [Pseudomonadota bacterium]
MNTPALHGPVPSSLDHPLWQDAARVRASSPITRERFAADIRGGDQPVILRGQVANWPLVRAGQTSSDALCEVLLRDATDAPVRFFEGLPAMGGRFFYSEDLLGLNFERREASFGEFLERVSAASDQSPAPHLYAGAIQVPQNAPALASSHDHGLLEPAMEQLVSLWIGNRSRTAAHFDLPQNLACVLRGRRRFILLPIDQLANLYVGPLDRTLAGQPVSLVDFLAPDFERHPRFRDALEHALIADLEPGDALYVPSLWFHHVETLDDFGAMMNFWWRDAPSHLFTPMITLMHSLLSIRGLPDHERAAWKTVFDHYVFETNGDPMAHMPETARGMFGEMTPEKLQRLKYYLGKSLS